MPDILMDNSCPVFFLLHLLVQWEYLDVKSHALGAGTVPDLCRLYCMHSFFWSELQQLDLFIDTKATGPLAVHFKLLFQKQWFEAETWDSSQPAPWGLSWPYRVSPQAPLTCSGSGCPQGQKCSTKHNLLGSSPPSLGDYKDLRSTSSTSQRPPHRAVVVLRTV